MDASNFITHKSPRLSVLERIAWLAGKTCGRLGRLTCTNANGVVSVPEWPSNWEWDTPADIAALDCGGGDVAYRFGFQGQEKDDEIYGATGTSYAFEYRMHDPRVGRFLSVDPLAAKYAYNSPYAFAENKVIQFIELEGLEIAESAANSGSTNTVEPPTLTGALMGGSDINLEYAFAASDHHAPVEAWTIAYCGQYRSSRLL
jgi:RHS repeat-associated protein